MGKLEYTGIFVVYTCKVCGDVIYVNAPLDLSKDVVHNCGEGTLLYEGEVLENIIDENSIRPDLN